MDKSNQSIYTDMIAWLRLAIGQENFPIVVANQKGKKLTGEHGSILAIDSRSVGTGATVMTHDGVVEAGTIVSGTITPDLAGTYPVQTGIPDSITVKDSQNNTWILPRVADNNGHPQYILYLPSTDQLILRNRGGGFEYYDTRSGEDWWVDTIPQSNGHFPLGKWDHGGGYLNDITVTPPPIVDMGTSAINYMVNGKYSIHESGVAKFSGDDLFGDYTPDGASTGIATVADQEESDTITLNQSSLREVSLSVEFLRGDAHDYMRKVMNFPNTNASKEFMFGKGMSVFIPNMYRNLDDTLPDGFTARAQIDFRLHCSTEYAETVNAIDDVDITVDVDV